MSRIPLKLHTSSASRPLIDHLESPRRWRESIHSSFIRRVPRIPPNSRSAPYILPFHVESDMPHLRSVNQTMWIMVDSLFCTFHDPGQEQRQFTSFMPPRYLINGGLNSSVPAIRSFSFTLDSRYLTNALFYSLRPLRVVEISLSVEAIAPFCSKRIHIQCHVHPPLTAWFRPYLGKSLYQLSCGYLLSIILSASIHSLSFISSDLRTALTISYRAALSFTAPIVTLDKRIYHRNMRIR